MATSAVPDPALVAESGSLAKAAPEAIPATSLHRARRALAWRTATELLLIVLVAFSYAGSPLLDFNRLHLQQTSEHNEAATLPVLTEIGLRRAHVIPLWNPYMSSGFPYAGDFVSNFWNPVATLPVLLWGGVNGYKVSAFLSFLIAGVGQWLFGYVLGLRSAIRLWSALLFMLSGGLALFWRLGWYQLLVGVVWFPWCFAALVWALRTHSRPALALAALAITMVLTSAGGYYYFYLAGALTTLTLVLLVLAPARQRVTQLKRAVAIVALSAGLLAVVILPGIDVYRFTVREAFPDPRQGSSQPIPYALFQYVVSDPNWFNTDILGQANGFTWFYIGALPLLALAFVPLGFNRSRRRRDALVVLTVLTGLFLAWHANRHTVVGWVYKALPVLYTFRFPGRLLIVGASPLIVLGGFGLQSLWLRTRRVTRPVTFRLVLSRREATSEVQIRLSWLVNLALIILLAQSVLNVRTVNQPFAFTTNRQRDQRALRAMTWLRERDPSLYSIAAGDWRVWWWWTTAAYELEQPVLNFAYNRFVSTFRAQQTEGSVVRARPKYVFPWQDQPPAGGRLLGDFEGLPVYEMPNALPYAFAISPERLAQRSPLTPADVRALDARWLNPNQLVVDAPAGPSGQQLVALVSMFPGWKVSIDGQPVALTPVNDYLGVTMLDGAHTYTFSFEPPLFFVGLGISLLTLLIVLWLLVGQGWRHSITAGLAVGLLRSRIKQRA
ncbi:MAG: hypothetical protein M5U01_16385 [Ardenticatenaceae bacterium]|nr:hypothetical protein [Ardenticatenaceae bacterium]